VTHNSARHATLFELPAGAQVVARYPIAVLKGRRADLARSFVDFVLSPAGQAALEKEMFSKAP
jgi:ABC-type molybdate transport system substrate-binding protein